MQPFCKLGATAHTASVCLSVRRRKQGGLWSLWG